MLNTLKLILITLLAALASTSCKTTSNIDSSQYMDAKSLVQRDYPELYKRYISALSKQDEITEKLEIRRENLEKTFKENANIELVMVNFGELVQSKLSVKPNVDHVSYNSRLSIIDHQIRGNFIGKNERFRSKKTLVKRLDELEIFYPTALDSISKSYLVVDLHLKNIVKKYDNYIQKIDIPKSIEWNENTPSIKIIVTITFIPENILAERENKRISEESENAERKIKESAVKLEKELKKIISENKIRSAKMADLDNNIGQRYCSNGHINYLSSVCSSTSCWNKETTEPAQLQAYLEGFTEDRQRLRLRILNWANSTGRVYYIENSDILFLAETWRQKVKAGIVFWSNIDDWFLCKQ